MLKHASGFSNRIFLTPLPSPIVHPGSTQTVTLTPVGPGGPMIVDGQGHVVWFHQLQLPEVAGNLRIQHYAGKPVLTWWQGPVTVAAYGLGEGVIADTRYRTLHVVHAGNGYAMDIHEFSLTPEGDALFTVYSPVLVHLPGTPPGTLTSLIDAIVQEVDVRTGLVTWEWHALGHIPLRDSYATPANSAFYDAFHINSIQPLARGRVLISSRDTSAVYELDRATATSCGRWAARPATSAWPAARASGSSTTPRCAAATTSACSTTAPAAAEGARVTRADPRSSTCAATSRASTASTSARTTPRRRARAACRCARAATPSPASAPRRTSPSSPTPGSSFDAACRRRRQLPRLQLPLEHDADHQPAVDVTARGPGGVAVYASWNGATRSRAGRCWPAPRRGAAIGGRAGAADQTRDPDRRAQHRAGRSRCGRWTAQGHVLATSPVATTSDSGH